MIMGQDKPDGGELIVGSTVKPMCVDQSRDTLDASKSVYEVLSENGEELVIGGRGVPARCVRFRRRIIESAHFSYMYALRLFPLQRLCQLVQLQGRRPAEARGRPVRRRAQQAAPRAHAPHGRQPAAA